jgi:signal transduction histidine kinase
MNALTISFNDKTSMVYQPPRVFDSTIKATISNNHRYKPRVTTKRIEDLQAQFAFALVHEVRNPLTNINLAIEMLGSAIQDNQLKIYLDIITRSSIRINSLICDLLKHQENEVQVEKHSIHQLLDEVLEMAGDRVRLKKIAVWKDYTSNDSKIELNRLEMLIGLTNIVVNAIDAMTPGKGELKLATKSINGRHVIQIEDNGCGISKENLKNIFKPHFTNKVGGLGIGLATTYNILRSNNVGVKIESEEGQGTRFILTFEEKHQYRQSSN